MAIHIYMSATQIPRDEETGLFVQHPDDLFNYRGEAGVNDDAQRFRVLMASSGYEVLLRPTGEPPAIIGPTGDRSTKHWLGIPRRNLEEQQ